MILPPALNSRTLRVSGAASFLHGSYKEKGGGKKASPKTRSPGSKVSWMERRSVCSSPPLPWNRPTAALSKAPLAILRNPLGLDKTVLGLGRAGGMTSHSRFLMQVDGLTIGSLTSYRLF